MAHLFFLKKEALRSESVNYNKLLGFQIILIVVFKLKLQEGKYFTLNLWECESYDSIDWKICNKHDFVEISLKKSM